MQPSLPFYNFETSLHQLHCNTCNKDFYGETYDEMESWDIIHCDNCSNVIRIDWHKPLSKKVEEKTRLRNNRWNTKFIESYLKPCSCGGHFLYSAKPRCPFCKSDKVTKMKGIKTTYINYDPDSIWKDKVKNL